MFWMTRKRHWSRHHCCTTEKVTTSDQVHKRTDKIKTSEDIDKDTDNIHKCTDNITTSEEIDKGSEKLEDTKEAMIRICGKYSDKFEGHSKGSTGWFNLDNEFLKGKYSKFEPDLYEKLYERDSEGLDMEPSRTFLVPFDYTELKPFIQNNPV